MKYGKSDRPHVFVLNIDREPTHPRPTTQEGRVMTNDDDHIPSEIVQFANRAANDLAVEFHDDPKGEFIAWLHVALEREAMVAAAYDPDHLERHLSRLKATESVPDVVLTLLHRTIGDVWAQEEGHTAYIRACIEI